MTTAAEVLTFWFEETEPELRFKKDDAFDEAIRTRFGSLHAEAANGGLKHWEGEAESCLALVIVLDQFSRNLFRGDPKSFASDAMALAIAKRAIAAGLHETLDPERRQFLFLPFEHSEDLDDQHRCMELMATLDSENAMDYARQHLVIIERFGRFPHRNAVLGRASTEEEIAFLEEPDSSF